jgi:(R)-2-hydroxyacyl-CoA dehydratese activating ATPase
VVKALEEKLACHLFVPDEPLISGALGAALLGREGFLRARADGHPELKRERRLAEATFFDEGNSSRK